MEGIILNRFVEEAYKNSKEKGFWDDERNVGEMLMLVVTELAEALEAYRCKRMGVEEKDTFEDEIADVFIRLADRCGGMGIEIERQINWKMHYNKGRERLHGKEF